MISKKLSRNFVAATLSFGLVLQSISPIWASGDHIIETLGKSRTTPLTSEMKADGYMYLWFDDVEESKYSLIPHPKGFQAVLPPCSRTTAGACVLSLSARKFGQEWQSARLLDTEPRGLEGLINSRFADGSTQRYGTFAEDVTKGVLEGGKLSTWSLASFAHSLGTEYGVSVMYSTLQEGTRNKRLRLQVIPLKWNAPVMGQIPSDATPREILDYKRGTFPNDVEFELKVRLGVLESMMPTWFYSRAKDSSMDADNGILTVVAKPGRGMRAESDFISCPHSLFQSLSASDLRRSQIVCDLARSQSSKTAGTVFLAGIDDDSQLLSYFTTFMKYIYPVGSTDSWWFEAIEDLSPSVLQRCLTSPISGIGSSNAVIFPTVLPRWNQTTQELVYDIASTKADESGKANYGYFELSVSEQFAKCAWEIDDFSYYQAAVSITGSDAEQKIETFSSSRLNGFFKFRIANFGFSAPKIAVRFTRSAEAPTKNYLTDSSETQTKPRVQESTEVGAKPLAQDSSGVTSTRSVSKSFVCVKGKKVKTLGKASGKCPRGFTKRVVTR